MSTLLWRQTMFWAILFLVLGLGLVIAGVALWSTKHNIATLLLLVLGAVMVLIIAPLCLPAKIPLLGIEGAAAKIIQFLKTATGPILVSLGLLIIFDAFFEFIPHPGEPAESRQEKGAAPAKPVKRWREMAMGIVGGLALIIVGGLTTHQQFFVPKINPLFLELEKFFTEFDGADIQYDNDKNVVITLSKCELKRNGAVEEATLINHVQAEEGVELDNVDVLAVEIFSTDGEVIEGFIYHFTTDTKIEGDQFCPLQNKERVLKVPTGFDEAASQEWLEQLVDFYQPLYLSKTLGSSEEVIKSEKTKARSSSSSTPSSSPPVPSAI